MFLGWNFIYPCLTLLVDEIEVSGFCALKVEIGSFAYDSKLMKFCLDWILLVTLMIFYIYLWWIDDVWMNWKLWPYGQVMDEFSCGKKNGWDLSVVDYGFGGW